MGDGHRQTITTGSWKGSEYRNRLHVTMGHNLSAQKLQNSSKIKRITSSPYHPSGNGQAKSTNKTIVQNLKKRLEAAKCHWPKELPRVLWAYRTMAKSTTGETLFSLVYGMKALIPVEVGEPALRYLQEDEESNNEAMLINLEFLEECRKLAHVRLAAQKQRMERYYNQRTNLRYFKVGDLVLRKVTQKHPRTQRR
ncbi:uncharacterized protein [Nicotiana tomentosiformis]|uniref:uncharacterized protein n=1 Tax=Nicotiana tomentosiformis TaxID=4098 RepID=UPI00388CB65C